MLEGTGYEAVVTVVEALPTGDRITSGPLRVAAILDEENRGRVIVSAMSPEEGAKAVAALTTGLLEWTARAFNLPAAEVAVMAASGLIAQKQDQDPRPEGGDE